MSCGVTLLQAWDFVLVVKDNLEKYLPDGSVNSMTRVKTMQNVQDSYWMSRGIANLIPEQETKNCARCPRENKGNQLYF